MTGPRFYPQQLAPAAQLSESVCYDFSFSNPLAQLPCPAYEPKLMNRAWGLRRESNHYCSTPYQAGCKHLSLCWAHLGSTVSISHTHPNHMPTYTASRDPSPCHIYFNTIIWPILHGKMGIFWAFKKKKSPHNLPLVSEKPGSSFYDSDVQPLFPLRGDNKFPLCLPHCSPESYKFREAAKS